MSDNNAIKGGSLPPSTIKRCYVSNIVEQQIFVNQTIFNFSQVDEDPDLNYSAGVWTSDKTAIYNIKAGVQVDDIATYGTTINLEIQLIYDDNLTPVVIGINRQWLRGSDNYQFEVRFDRDYLVPSGDEIHVRLLQAPGNGIRMREFPQRSFLTISEVG